MHTSGTIKKIDESFIYISYFRKSACSECHNKKACLESDSKEEQIKIEKDKLDFVPEKNMSVKLSIDYYGSPIKLLFLIYGFPVLSLLLTAIIMQSMGIGEPLILLGILLSLIISLSIIKIFEKKLVKEKKIGINVKKQKV